MIRPLSVLLVCLALPLTIPALAAERPRRAVAAESTIAAPAISILSIIPAQAEPGGRVLLSGSDFGTELSAFLGNVELPARVSDGEARRWQAGSR